MQDTFLARATRTISRVFVKKKKDSKASFDPLNSEVPPIVEACCVFLETYALNTEGLFRLSGQFNVIESVKKQFEKGKLTSFPPETDHHLIAGLLKCWLCALEMPLLTYELAETFIQSIEAPEAEERIRRLCAVISMLPECNRRVFQRLIGLFSLVHGHRDQNMMGAKNLAIVFAPTLLRYSVPDLSVMLKMSDAANTVMETCILNYGPLFVDTDAYMAPARGSSVRFESGVQVLHYVKMPETLQQGLTDEELERRRKREQAAQSVAQESAAILAQEEKKKPKLDEELVQHAKTVLSDMATRARVPTELELRREQEEAEKRATVELETLARKQLELEKEEQKQREELQALEREQEQLKIAQASSLEMQLQQLQGDIEELETSLRALRKESLGDQDTELAAAEEFLMELREEEAQIKKLIEEEQQLKSIEEEERLLLKQLSGETDVDVAEEEARAREAPCIAVQVSSEDAVKGTEADVGSSERPSQTAPANDTSADVLMKALQQEEAELQEILEEQSRLSVVVRERVASIGNAEDQARLEEELRRIEEEAALLEEENASQITDKETDESAHADAPASSGGTAESLPSAGGAVDHEMSAAANESGAEVGGDAAGERELPEKDTSVRDVADDGKEEDVHSEKPDDEELIDEEVVDEELAAQEELLRQLEEEARLLEESGVELELSDETGGEEVQPPAEEPSSTSVEPQPSAQEPAASTVELHVHQQEPCTEATGAAAPSAATTQTAPATGGETVREPASEDPVGKASDACSALLTAKRRKEQREQEKAELLERERKEQALARERQAIADRMEQQRKEREELAAREEERRQQMERERMEAEREIQRRAEELRLKQEQQEAARQREEERERREMELRRQQQEQRREQEQAELARKKKERERRDEELREERQVRQAQQQSGLDVEDQLADLLDFVGKKDGPSAAPSSSQASQAEEDAEEDDDTGEVAVIEYTDGARYEGGVNGNQWEGRGRCFFADGTFYGAGLRCSCSVGVLLMLRPEGEVHEDHMHGTGTLVYVNGHKYVGQFERDERHGFGRYTSSNGDVYEGEFVRDKRCGKGVYRMANGAVYEGEFKNGMPNGTGKYLFETGDVYEGEFKDDEFHGKGTYRSAGGAVYCGDFVDGMKEGTGKYTLKNGDVYEGEFKGGKFNGHGVYTFSGGRGTMEGEFRNGKPVK